MKNERLENRDLQCSYREVSLTPKKTENIRLLLGSQMEVYGKPGDNMNSIVVGPPGCGKTFYYMLPTILCEDECSLIIDDKKGTLYRQSAQTLSEKGYQVLVMDFTKFEGNFKYNCFHNMKTEEDAMRMADFMIPPQGGKADRYWEMTSKDLFRCLMEIARFEYKNKLNLRLFLDLFNKCGLKSDDETDENGNHIADGIERIINKHRKKLYDYPSMYEYKRLKGVSEVTWNCTLNTLRAELKKYSSPRLLSLMDESTINFTWLGKRKTALFIISSDTDATMYPMIQLMYQDIADTLIKFADKNCAKNDNRLPIHVRFLIDDFASGVQQKQFQNLIANCRSRNISYMLGFQSISQLRALYKEHTESILDCVNYQIFYSSCNTDTHYHLAKAMQRPVREIQQMDDETICLIRRGRAPRFCKRVQTSELPEYVRSVKNGKDYDYGYKKETDERAAGYY